MENKKGFNIKLLIIIAVVFLLAILFCVYIFAIRKEDKGMPYNNPRKLANLYVESILKEDYSTVIKCIYFPQDTFINKSDIEKYFKEKSYYEDIKGKKITDVVETGYNNYQFVLSDKNDNVFKFNIEVVERTINDYRINEKNAYLEKMKISVPKNTKVYIGDILVEEQLIKEKGEYDDEYLIPGIAKNTKIIKLENKLGSKEYEVLPSEEEKNLELVIELNDEELLNRARSFIKDSWNTMYREYKNGSDVSKIKYLFDEKNTDEVIKKYYKNGFDKISQGTSSSSENINFELTDVIKGNDTNYVIGDDLIDISFGYKLKWQWHVKGYSSKINKDLRRYSGIRLKIDGDTFKIYDVLDTGLYSISNEYMKEF